MRLRNFRGICERCDGIRHQIEWGTISAKSAIESLSEYIDYLREEYDLKGVDLKEDCKNQALFIKANKIYGPYRRWRDEIKDSLTFYICEIKSTISELKNNNTDYSKDDVASLISALNRLYTTASFLSRICFVELGIIKKAGRKQKTERTKEDEIAESRKKIARTKAYKVAVEKGVIVNDFQWTESVASLLSWLTTEGIAKQGSNNRIDWGGIVDGTFNNAKGNPITRNSIYSYWSQWNK